MDREQSIESLIRRLVSLASEEFAIRDVYLFGSHAHGTPTEYSDIDVALVSDDFVGVRFKDVQRLLKYVVRTSSAIEVHPFKTEDFTPDNPFVEEILRTGKKITWN